ncbi:sulfite exporter TauE/SafE family protein [Bowmanella sp. JS7-9]|uniref:Sulfite exporter TauE/SafE family protein n=1 Tax=Pseudobowmanella zhangzhouensis TaxID=1537679 RepID=A0ABW1XLE3_9ALTE|nr:sulfite exporter TauE/SafE family protein [Bowmanella sp. JS7-9]TBX26025.1 hypothetical protein TK45_02130 [Bowmanella sp. JS7-9]
MISLSYSAALLIGLAGSLHCIGMCGGIVSAFRMGVDPARSANGFVLAYHAGRLSSYALAGALAGGLGQIVGKQSSGSVNLLLLLSGVMLVLLGLYIGNWWRGLTHLEQLGSVLWKRLAPLSRALLPVKHLPQAYLYGVVWGWLPCGLVYSTLSWSMASGSSVDGALVMVFFGVGTLPALLTVSLLGVQLNEWVKQALIRSLIGLSLVAFGLFNVLISLQISLY